MSRTAIVVAAALAFVATLASAPAQAQRDRVFVASYGNDSNPCTFGSPCKTFQTAVGVVAAGGEITAIDSAGFGPVTISHAVTITSPNGVEAGIVAPASGGAAITINADSGDVVSLNRLTLDGHNVTNTNGIVFNSGGSLNVKDGVIRHFANSGISVLPAEANSLQIIVSNTLVSDNGGIGIDIGGFDTSFRGVLDHVKSENNSVGLEFGDQESRTVTDSVIANNSGNGIVVSSASGTLDVVVRNSTSANNGGTGLLANGEGTTIHVTRSSVTGNGTGWDGGVLSYGDNNIDGNTVPTNTVIEGGGPACTNPSVTPPACSNSYQ
jgi:hypothetical protein